MFKKHSCNVENFFKNKKQQLIAQYPWLDCLPVEFFLEALDGTLILELNHLFRHSSYKNDSSLKVTLTLFAGFCSLSQLFVATSWLPLKNR